MLRPQCRYRANTITSADHPPQALSTDELSRIRHAATFYMLKWYARSATAFASHTAWFPVVSPTAGRRPYCRSSDHSCTARAEHHSSCLLSPSVKTVVQITAVSWSAASWPGQTWSRRNGQWPSNLRVRLRWRTSSGLCTQARKHKGTLLILKLLPCASAVVAAHKSPFKSKSQKSEGNEEEGPVSLIGSSLPLSDNSVQSAQGSVEVNIGWH